MDFSKYSKEELISLCDVYQSKIAYMEYHNKYMSIHPVSSMYSEEEVSQLLHTQRNNCWIVAYSNNIDQTILDKINSAPEPGQWKKSEQ